MKRIPTLLLAIVSLSSSAVSADACSHVDDQVSERECNVLKVEKFAREIEREEAKVRYAISNWDAEPESKKKALAQLSESKAAYQIYRDKTCTFSSAPAMYGRGQEDMRLICAYELNVAYTKRLQEVSQGFTK